MKTRRKIWGSGVLFFAMCLCLMFMPIQSKAAATYHTLSIDGQWMKEGSITDTYNTRYYTVTLPTAGFFEADFVTFADGLQWRLYDENFKLLNNWDSALWGGSESTPKTGTKSKWLEAGTYQIRIYRYGGKNGNFWLRASFRAAGNQEKEPNQTYASANPLIMGKTIRGLISYQDTHDYYSFTLTSPQTITQKLVCYHDGLRTRVMDSNMKELTNKAIWGGSEESPKVYTKDLELSAGTYYIHIDQYGSSYGLYDLTITPAAVPVSAVNLSKTSMTLYTGNTASLSASVVPSNATNKQVQWSSSNSSVATVSSNGVVTGKKAGTAMITVKAADGSGASASCNVTVKAKTLSVNKTKVTLYKGKSTTVKGTASPGAKVSYTTSNKKIATVNANGKITGKSKGSCKIYVKANGITKTVNVTVKNPTLTVNKSKLTLKVKKSFTLKAKATPTGKVTFTSSNKKIATVNSKGKVTAKKSGKCKIYVNANGIKKTVTVSVKKK